MKTRVIDIAVLTLAALPAIALLAMGNLTEAKAAPLAHATVLSQNTVDAGPAPLTDHG